jgi:hypothetical protein
MDGIEGECVEAINRLLTEGKQALLSQHEGLTDNIYRE